MGPSTARDLLSDVGYSLAADRAGFSGARILTKRSNYGGTLFFFRGTHARAALLDASDRRRCTQSTTLTGEELETARARSPSKPADGAAKRAGKSRFSTPGSRKSLVHEGGALRLNGIIPFVAARFCTLTSASGFLLSWIRLPGFISDGSGSRQLHPAAPHARRLQPPEKLSAPKPPTSSGNGISSTPAARRSAGSPAKIARVLRGKHKPIYTPHVDTGDHIIVINAAEVRLTGNKEETKVYYHHTGYIGNLKSATAKQVRASHPERLLMMAVKGMLPKNPLGRAQFRKLRVYAGPEHKQEAQLPQPLKLL